MLSQTPFSTPRLPGSKSLWAETFGAPRVCIAVLDGLVDYSHPCFNRAEIIELQTLVPGVAEQGVS